MRAYTIKELTQMYKGIGKDSLRVILARSEFDKYRCANIPLRIIEEGLPELERQITYNKTRRRARPYV